MLKHRVLSLFLIIVFVAVGFFVYKSEKVTMGQSPKLAKYAFKLGLDLNGGTQLTYRADVSKVKSGDINGAMSSLRDVIERRVNLFGVSEPVVQVENPGVVSGGVAKKVITAIGRLNGTYTLVDGQTSFGLQFSTFKTSRGTFRMIEHPLFNSNVSWQKMAVAVDLASFNVAYLGDRKTQNKEFNQDGNCADDNGIDAVGGTLTTELTAVVKNPPANAVIYNLTAGAAG
jgi:hypothetical protein